MAHDLAATLPDNVEKIVALRKLLESKDSAVRAALAFLLMLFISACVTTSEAEVLTYKAIAPEYTKYVNNDKELDQEQKDRRINTIKSWALRLKEPVK